MGLLRTSSVSLPVAVFPLPLVVIRCARSPGLAAIKCAERMSETPWTATTLVGDLQVNHLDLQNVIWVCILDEDRARGWPASVVLKVRRRGASGSEVILPLLLSIGSKVMVSKGDIVSRVIKVVD